jgi:hypothetical protein
MIWPLTFMTLITDYSWAVPPPDGVATDEDVALLQNWLDGFRNSDSDPFDGCEPGNPAKLNAVALLQRSLGPIL